jgi:ssDNA-binding Zn-finger/Zn-ribbon topoisomerase 1
MPEASQNLLFEVAMARGEDQAESQKTDAHFCPKCTTRMILKVSSEGKYKTGKYWQCPSQECGHIVAFV